MTNRARLIRNGAIAATIGAAIGAATGVWSLQRSTRPAASAAPPAAAIAVDASNVPKAGATSGASQPRPQSPESTPRPDVGRVDDAARSTSPRPPASIAAATALAANPGGDDARVLQRAKALAQRPDVVGLLALRDAVVRRAAERGMSDSPSIKSELDELDKRLNEARTLRLKLDAEAFRKAESNPPR
jgi:hypothetical protein